MSDQEALFDSTHEALIFAFNFADQQFAKSLMARLYAKHGSGKGLGGIDGAGEAGMIMASVLKLSQAEQDALCVRYTKVKSFCQCCGHEVHTSQVAAALSRLELYVKTADYGHDDVQNKKVKGVLNSLNLMLIRAVISEYFGLDTFGKLQALADKYNIHVDTAGRYRSYIKKMLRMLEQRAQKKIVVLLEESGKVKRDEY